MEMTSLLSSTGNVLVFVFLTLPGFLSVKYKLLSRAQIDGVTFLMFNFLWPAMIIDVMSNVNINDKLIHTVFYTGGISFLVYLVSIFSAFLYLRIKRTPAALACVLIFGMAFNNTGLIGMPFIKSVYGDEALFIASIIEVVNDILIFTIGILLIKPQEGAKRSVDIKSFLSPTFLSVIAGFFIFGFQLKFPMVISKPIRYLSNANTATAMFLVGAQFGEVSLKKLFRSKPAYSVTVFRLLLVPMLLYLILFTLLKDYSLQNIVIVIMSGMPSATCTAIMARQYKNNDLIATEGVIMSTLCSVITLPLMLALLHE